MPRKPLTIQPEAVTRLWLHLQGLDVPHGHAALTREGFVRHLEQTGGLQLDSVNAVERAHYLTLWSRFGAYDRAQLDAWIYGERLAYEYWGHEATILPISHLPLGLRRMRRFPPAEWKRAAWWPRWNTSAASKRRVLRLIRSHGPTERADIRTGPRDQHKEDKQSLMVLWHSGRIAVCERRHFRRVYDLAPRVYPEVVPTSGIALEDSWLMIGLRGNGLASEDHLVNYWTGPRPNAALRRRILERNIRAQRIIPVQVHGFDRMFYVLPVHLDMLERVPAPRGTTLVCPFDSLLWQRKRAEDLLNFSYRIEIYVPKVRRIHGYYVCPILHNGRLVGRLDPKLHRARSTLEIKRVFLEPGVVVDPLLRAGLRDTLESLATFLGAADIEVRDRTVVDL